MYQGLIVCDNDGTLLPYGHTQLEARTKRVIRKAIDKGFLFAVASGRPYIGLKDLFKDFADDIILICNNGAMVYSRGKLLREPQFIEVSVAKDLIADIFAESDIDLTVFTERTTFLVEREPGRNERVFDMQDVDFERLGIKVVKSFSEVSGNILQMGIQGGHDEEEMVNRLIKKIGVDLSVFPSGPGVIDITSNSKGEALLELSRRFDIPVEKTYAFGDSHNDMSMLKVAGHSYLMDDADERLKKLIPNRCAHVSDVLEELLK